jgi:hypothetical protein
MKYHLKMAETIFNNDINRLVALSSNITDFITLSLLNKSFNKICNDKIILLSKFSDKDLFMLNNNIVTIKQYVDEYKKISYATHTATCLYDMINKHKLLLFNIIYGHQYDCNIEFLDVTFISKIIPPSVYRSFLYYKLPNLKLYMDIKDDGRIGYVSFTEGRGQFLSSHINNNKDDIILLLIKILYYYPNNNFKDHNNTELIIRKNYMFDFFTSKSYQFCMNARKEYWKECDEKYYKYYF